MKTKESQTERPAKVHLNNQENQGSRLISLQALRTINHQWIRRGRQKIGKLDD